MVDSYRSLAALQTLFADQSTGQISPQKLRDFLVSVYPSVVRRPQAYGVAFDGVTNDTAAWDAFWAEVPANATVELPAGTTLVDQIDIPLNCSFIGPGPASCSIKARSGSAGPLLNRATGTLTSFSRIGGFTLDLTDEPDIVACAMNDLGAGSLVERIYMYKGIRALDVASCGNAIFRDLVCVGQTSKFIRVNGDDSAELFWDHIICDVGAEDLEDGFEIYRANATDIGGHYLNSVKLTGPSGSIDRPFYFHSDSVNSFFGIQMHDCVGDAVGITKSLHAVNVQSIQLTKNWFISAVASGNDALRLEGCIYVQSGGANRFGGAISFDSACDFVALSPTDLIQWGDYAYRMPASGTPTNLNLEAMINADALSNDLTKLLTATGSGSKMGKNSIFAHRILLRDTAGGSGVPFLQNTSDQFQFWGADGNFKFSIANAGIFAAQPLLGFPDASVDIGAAANQFRDLYLSRNAFFSGLPTADPTVAGQLWIDTGAGRVLKVSAG